MGQHGGDPRGDDVPGLRDHVLVAALALDVGRGPALGAGFRLHARRLHQGAVLFAIRFVIGPIPAGIYCGATPCYRRCHVISSSTPRSRSNEAELEAHMKGGDGASRQRSSLAYGGRVRIFLLRVSVRRTRNISFRIGPTPY